MHNPGRKDDGGKFQWALLMNGLALALRGVLAVLMFGAKKYAPDSWQRVENGPVRYKDALYRHLSEMELHGFYARDEETGLYHAYHVACNAMFMAHFAASKRVRVKKETDEV